MCIGLSGYTAFAETSLWRSALNSRSNWLLGIQDNQPRGHHMKAIDFSAPRNAASHDEVSFDLRRMEKAISGQRFVMPEGLSREEFREWMRENARKCRSK